jgi:septum formation protein
MEKRIYLASRSPRRQDLLQQIGISFELLILRAFPASRADLSEAPLQSDRAPEYALRLARRKAEIGWQRMLERRLPRLPVLGADTTIALDDEIVGKPVDPVAAEAILRRLSGRAHDVHTAVAVAFDGVVALRSSVSRVSFSRLDDDDIRRYVASGEAMDKAGAYAIQGRAAAFVTSLQGSYSGVVGLPLFETCELLRQLGMRVP